MTSFYLASRYARRLELRNYAEQLKALGHTITSRWLYGSHEVPDRCQPIEAWWDHASRFADEDLQDVDNADTLILFTEERGAAIADNTGGRWVEFGFAVASGKGVYVVGPVENIFATGADACFPTWEHCRLWIQEEDAL